MGRIRSIKPEFPQSESVGKLSRDARLLFIQLWTIVDDEGRARAASRMLASLLFPYDDDARDLIEGWMDELESEGLIRRYMVDGSSYLDIPHWSKHQKIDHKSVSKLPPFESGTQVLARPRECSRSLAPDLGKDQEGIGEEEDHHLSEPSSDAGDVPREIHPSALLEFQNARTTSTDSAEALSPAPPKRIAYSADFDEFWSAYPTDKLMSKKKAFDAWKRLTPEDRAKAHSAVKPFITHCRKNPTYRPVHAVRFLSERRFDGFAGTHACGAPINDPDDWRRAVL